MNEYKLSIKEVPLANDKLAAQTARQLKISESKVNDIMSFMGGYIADVIRTGAMEGVILPYFGKIRAKEKMVKRLHHKSNTNKNIIYRAMKGKPVKPDKDETI